MPLSLSQATSGAKPKPKKIVVHVILSQESAAVMKRLSRPVIKLLDFVASNNKSIITIIIGAGS